MPLMPPSIGNSWVRNQSSVSVSLPPTTTVWIHAATRPDRDHVYAVPESLDFTELMPTEERELARARGYLLEIPRHDLQGHYVRG